MSATTKKAAVYWISEAPTKCQMSDRDIGDTFVDGRLPGTTQWGLFHPEIFAEYGGELGLGKGQRYERQAADGIDAGRWLKVEG